MAGRDSSGGMVSWFLMKPTFIYFDLGRVLLNFSVPQMLEQVAAVAGITAEQARAACFGRELVRQHEAGQLSCDQFVESLCEASGKRPDRDNLAMAFCDIFEVNLPVLPLVAQLHQAGYAMGILSNTSATHWEYCLRRYCVLSEAFAVHALSFRIRAMKPEAAIFQAAANLAGVRPEEIFFVDDLAEHVAGAKRVGFDAVQFTTAAALAAALRERGVRFNY